jgi:hypothetical protein
VHISAVQAERIGTLIWKTSLKWMVFQVEFNAAKTEHSLVFETVSVVHMDGG